MLELAARQQVLIEALTAEGGKDPLEDRFRCGYIAAVSDLLNISIEEIA